MMPHGKGQDAGRRMQDAGGRMQDVGFWSTLVGKLGN